MLYAAFGVASPFWPKFFETRGLGAEQIGLILAASTLIRLAAGPLVGRLADLSGRLRLTLAICAVALLVLSRWTFGHWFGRGHNWSFENTLLLVDEIPVIPRRGSLIQTP